MERKSVAKTTPDALRVLWEAKFLFEPKTKDQIITELEKKGHNFEEEAMRKALERADFITRKGAQSDKRFVQKYPFTEESKDE